MTGYLAIVFIVLALLCLCSAYFFVYKYVKILWYELTDFKVARDYVRYAETIASQEYSLLQEQEMEVAKSEATHKAEPELDVRIIPMNAIPPSAGTISSAAPPNRM
eukprot:CAMPEP_0181340262 /NCGR_PEP_ID=MMETSP1101-20121128/29743_1 /TAXON_ID=46948 /ORGANISM="Rhodomonas abbreviata, Strain Caron Lab Isolate" /LENGTH=105 /DNA_ID=CAMNT_0023451381 /DNA_START=1 /DNA_END=318 /DNA_ORIENTATION=-